jgi:hypothetical protein
VASPQTVGDLTQPHHADRAPEEAAGVAVHGQQVALLLPGAQPVGEAVPGEENEQAVGRLDALAQLVAQQRLDARLGGLAVGEHDDAFGLEPQSQKCAGDRVGVVDGEAQTGDALVLVGIDADDDRPRLAGCGGRRLPGRGAGGQEQG